MERHQHEDDGLLGRRARLAHEARPRALHQVEGEPGDGAEAATLDHDGLLVEHLGGLHHVPRRREHGRVRETLLDELQAHEAVVHPDEGRPGELDHVHVEALARQLVQERTNEPGGIGMAKECAVDQVDAEDAERLLLGHGGAVVQGDVDDRLGRLGLGLVLEADADPAAAVVVVLEAASGHGVGEGEEGGGGAAARAECLHEQVELAREHGLEPLAADIALGGAVESVADAHVVGGDGLGDGARGAPHVEEPGRHLLPGPDLRDGAVLDPIEIELEGLLLGRGVGAGHARNQPVTPEALASWRETRCA